MKLNSRNLALAITAGMMVISGCAGDNKPATVGTAEPVKVEPLGKYGHPVELTTFRKSDTNIKFDEGESYEKNAVYDAYEKDFNIQLKNKWVVDGKQYQDKLRVSIASGDLPDFFEVGASELQMLIESDLVMDVTGVYEKWASPETKKYLSSDGGKQLNSAEVGDKLYGIPNTSSPYNNAQMVYVRKDWMNKLGLSEPKTMQDLLKISEAFTTQDPDGNGKADSYGIGLMKEIYNTSYGLLGFFNSYHAYPQSWLKDASGNLVYGSISPEMKTSLKQLQDMFKAGQIDKEFVTKDHAKVTELIANDKLGVVYGLNFLVGWPMKTGVVKNGKVASDWAVYAIPSVDSKPAMAQIGLGLTGDGMNGSGYYVINKNAKNPEAVMKILNKWVLNTIKDDRSPEVQVYQKGKNLKDGNNYWKLNPITPAMQDVEVESGILLPKAVEAKDIKLVRDLPIRTLQYEEMMKYLGGAADFWPTWMKVNGKGSYSILNQYKQEDRYLYNGYIGSPTPSMADKKPLLDKLEMETFTNIIMGKVSIDEFDKFVTSWKAQGGNDLTKEVNEASKKK